MPAKHYPVLDTPTGQEIIQSYADGGLKLDAAWERRLPTIYRLIMAGASKAEIHRLIGGEQHKLYADIEAVRYLIDDIPDIERIRSDISVELDQLYLDTIATLHESNDPRGGTKAKLIEQAREILMGKADLYGLRSATLNVNNNTRLLSIAADLRNLGSANAPESGAAPVHLGSDRVQTLPVADSTIDGYYKPGDSGDGWRTSGEVPVDVGTGDELPAVFEPDLDRRA